MVMNPEDDSRTLNLTVSIRGLAESQYRTGGLAAPFYGGVEGLAGIRTHQRYFDALRVDQRVSELYTESSFSGMYRTEDTSLTVKGRADAWFLSQNGLTLVEVKSFRGAASRLPAKGEDVHWAQAKLYAYLLLLQTGAASLTIELTYVSTEVDDDIVILRETETLASLEAFFNRLCLSFIESTRSLRRYIAARNEANRAASFPYDGLRDGQKLLMRRVMDTMLAEGSLLASAPTGIGKTIATLYPALKAQANGIVDRIFYLTHTTATRIVAETALADLRAAGFLVRAVTLYAKESLCLEPDLYCDQRRCPYALDYYERLPEALSELYRLQIINPESLLPIAKKHRLCPFELSLDVSSWCDVIICDYNYVYDPRVRLQRFFADVGETYAILVDEAHNLPSRAREMYSARLELDQLTDVYTLLLNKELGPPTEGSDDLKAMVRRAAEETISLHNELAAVASSLSENEEGPKGFARIDASIQAHETVMTETFLAAKRLPAHLIGKLSRLYRTYALLLETFNEWDGKLPLLHLWFDLAFFIRVGQTLFDYTYLITLGKTRSGRWQLSLQCLDASDRMAKSVSSQMARVYFSATLTPMEFYLPLLSIPEDEAESLILPSPFPEQNRLVMASDHCSIRYKDRAQSLPAVASLILTAVSKRRGNYLVFVPSFQYLSRLTQHLETLTLPPDLELMPQRPGMSFSAREAFLKRFETTGEKTLLAISVIGSLFNEGVDLVGDQLIGVMIVGTGLPGISPERTLMGEYFQHRLGDGFRFAYVYPGFNRVLQAAGRLIRSETDTGFILLIDDRYKREDYRQLLPEEWQTQFVGGDEDVASYLEEFWSGID